MQEPTVRDEVTEFDNNEKADARLFVKRKDGRVKELKRKTELTRRARILFPQTKQPQ